MSGGKKHESKSRINQFHFLPCLCLLVRPVFGFFGAGVSSESRECLHEGFPVMSVGAVGLPGQNKSLRDLSGFATIS